MNIRSVSKAVVLAAAVAVSASACVIKVNRSGTVPQGATGSTSGSTIVIANQSSENICVVRFSSSSDSNWGPDQLGETEQILPGQARGWPVSAGTYDVRAEDCSGGELDRAMGVEVADAPAVLTYGG